MQGAAGCRSDADIHAALEQGDLYAASLDVFETEPAAGLEPALGPSRVVVTPHSGPPKAHLPPSCATRYARCAPRAGVSRSTNLVDRSRGY